MITYMTPSDGIEYFVVSPATFTEFVPTNPDPKSWIFLPAFAFGVVFVMTGLPSAAAEDWHGPTFVIGLEVTVPAGVVTVTGPFVAPAPTRAYMMMFEPT